jgi:hypothetical protein
MGVGYQQNFAMRPRDVLAENLKKLMAGTPELSTFPQITKAGGGSNGTLDRIRRKTTATSVDNLEPLAGVFGLEPWHLLLDTLAVQDGKVAGIPRYKEGDLTPEALQIAKWFDRLTDPRDRAVAETAAMGAILDRLQKHDLPPTDRPAPAAEAEEPPAPSRPPAPTPPPKPAKTHRPPAERSGRKG